MDALATLFPVFFMIGLGLVSRIRGWITPEQKEGANNIVFNVLFPILIFNVLFTANIELHAIYIIGYVFIAFVLAMVIGKLFTKFTGEKYGHISYYLMTTCEGGNVALPLYTSIVGVAYASNTVIFDIAGTLIAFVVVPILIAKNSAGETSGKDLLKTIFTNSFVLAVIFALVLNLTGFHDFLNGTEVMAIYTNTVASATAPIMGMILFIIGYNLKISMESLPSLLKLVILRIAFYALVILGFFVLFPGSNMMGDKIYMMAVLIYFMSPTGFALPMVLSPAYENEDDEDFAAAFISLFMVITLIVYTITVLFIA